MSLVPGSIAGFAGAGDLTAMLAGCRQFRRCGFSQDGLAEAHSNGHAQSLLKRAPAGQQQQAPTSIATESFS